MNGRRSRLFLQRLRELQEPWAVEYVHQLTAWLALEPEPERSRLARALDSDDIGTFHSAAFELFLTGYFRSRGWSVHRHPPLQQSVRVPDFLVEGNNASFYAGAVVGQDPPQKRAQRRVLLALADELEAVEGPFHAIVTPTGLWDDRFSRSLLRQFLEQQLRQLEGQPDVEEASIDYTLDPHLPLRFEVLRTDDIGPVVGGWSLTGDIAATVTTHETLYDRIQKKASRYGKLDRPYVRAFSLSAGSASFPHRHPRSMPSPPRRRGSTSSPVAGYVDARLRGHDEVEKPATVRTRWEARRRRIG